MQLDLVAVDEQAVVNQQPNVSNMCVLPDMGNKPDDGEPFDPFEIGSNDPKHHDRVQAAIVQAIDHAEQHRIPFVIVFTGMATDSPFQQQIELLIVGFKDVANYAQEKGVVLVLEMLNTLITTPMQGHPGYLGNSTDRTAQIVESVGSPNFGLVLDIYHMQIMGENPVEMIERHGHLVRYVHVAGAYPVSSATDAKQRAELHHENQLTDYSAVMATLKKVHFGGPVAFEYIPTTNDSDAATANLRQALKICDLEAP
jgi:hydroxypyruvate isomerase